MDITQQFNQWAPENKNMIRKALTSASGSAGALIAEHLEAVVTNAVPRISAELAVMTPKYDSQSSHSFDQLTALNGIGAAMGESSTTPTTQPTFARQTVTLKVMKKKGTTTDFLRAATQKKIDAAAANMETTLIYRVAA